MHPLEWFTKRIGKRIYRNPLHGKGHCVCRQCEHVTKVGLVVKDENHAKYLHMIQTDLQIKYND